MALSCFCVVMVQFPHDLLRKGTQILAMTFKTSLNSVTLQNEQKLEGATSFVGMNDNRCWQQSHQKTLNKQQKLRVAFGELINYFARQMVRGSDYRH